MWKRTAERLNKLCAAALCEFCLATICCALAATATTIHAQTRRGHARAATIQTSRARRASQPASTSSTSPTQSSSSAQSSPDAAPTPSVPEEDADLVIIANVTAKELRFDAVPNPKVEFPGKPERATEWSAERTNLPPQVQPGVTYRNIGIRLKIVSRFADIDRIVAEALGEVPVTDDTPQANTTTPTTITLTETTPPVASSRESHARDVRVVPSRKTRARGARRSG